MTDWRDPVDLAIGVCAIIGAFILAQTSMPLGGMLFIAGVIIIALVALD